MGDSIHLAGTVRPSSLRPSRHRACACLCNFCFVRLRALCESRADLWHQRENARIEAAHDRCRASENPRAMTGRFRPVADLADRPPTGGQCSKPTVGATEGSRHEGSFAKQILMVATASQRRDPAWTAYYLWASQDTIYGRFGFGLASFAGEIDMPRERSTFHALPVTLVPGNFLTGPLLHGTRIQPSGAHGRRPP